MNYIVDRLEYNLIQFCPAEALSNETSFRTAAICARNEEYFWFLQDQKLRKDLPEIVQATLSGSELPNSELVCYHPDDKLILIVRSTDSHLYTAQLGFRCFLVSFRKKKGNITIRFPQTGKTVDGRSAGLNTE